MYGKILIIGGYGGVGRALVESLVRYYAAEVFIGGRNKEKGLGLKEAIQRKYPEAILHYRQVDAADRKSLEHNFQDVDLAIVTAPFRIRSV
ncbi:MAG: SDR family NAD(P)-dependent oxidoreductase [Saprospiraceae bacterium]|nr:SDR family NAD(P)-dependent oxidoreductase [Saprospiraceae bacterium]